MNSMIWLAWDNEGGWVAYPAHAYAYNIQVQTIDTNHVGPLRIRQVLATNACFSWPARHEE